MQEDRPTIDRVRMRLGSGFPNTISDHLDVWWTKLGARVGNFRNCPSTSRKAFSNCGTRRLPAHMRCSRPAGTRAVGCRHLRAEALERSLQERDEECARLRARTETLESSATELREKSDATATAHQTERTRQACRRDACGRREGRSRSPRPPPNPIQLALGNSQSPPLWELRQSAPYPPDRFWSQRSSASDPPGAAPSRAA